MIKPSIYFLTVAFLFCTVPAMAQSVDNSKPNRSGFREFYPIHSKPSISYLSNMNDFEEILFDAKPIVYYSFYNNIRHKLETEAPGMKYAIYAVVQPHVRMYSERSLPVKTPSYRILLGWQGLYRTDNNHFISYAIESGHYSNGQSGCSFGPGVEDETPQCDAIHALITDQSDLSALLNRSNGNFSANLTRLSFNYRLNRFEEANEIKSAHSFSAAWEFYHQNMFWVYDRGGYTAFDKTIYPENIFVVDYEFIHNLSSKWRYAFGIKTEIIQGAHPSVDPFRAEIQFTAYPFRFNRSFGVFATYITGHDNYNYRFVDSGSQVNIGITWDWFTTFEINGRNGK